MSYKFISVPGMNDDKTFRLNTKTGETCKITVLDSGIDKGPARSPIPRGYDFSELIKIPADAPSEGIFDGYSVVWNGEDLKGLGPEIQVYPYIILCEGDNGKWWILEGGLWKAPLVVGPDAPLLKNVYSHRIPHVPDIVKK